jgi:hypothetical protein
MTRLTLALAILLALSAPAWSHPGQTDVDGCHADRKTGERHCHDDQKRIADDSRPRSNFSAQPAPHDSDRHQKHHRPPSRTERDRPQRPHHPQVIIQVPTQVQTHTKDQDHDYGAYNR